MWPKIKLILKSTREYKVYAFLSPICMIGEALMECVLPFHMTLLLTILESMTDGVNWSRLVPLFVSLLLMTCISIACGILGGIVASKASCGLAKNLRNDVYEKVNSFSFGNIDKFQASSLITRMTTDINNIQMAFLMTIRIIVRAPLMLIFSIIMAFVTGGYLALIFLALVPVLALASYMLIKKAFVIFQRIFKMYDSLNESVEENVSGIRVVKSYVREDFEQQKFNNASDKMTGEFIHAEKLAALAMPIFNTVIHVSNLIILLVGSLIILNGWNVGVSQFGVAEISALVTYGIQILASLLMISMALVLFVMSLEGIKRVYEVLTEKSSLHNPKNPLYKVKDGSIVFKNVSFKYKKEAEKYTLSNINMQIKSGQFIGIIGSTGSGKTSVVNLISRLYDVTEGSIEVGGQDVRKYDLVTLRDNVAVVLQKNVLFSGTIESNLRWGDLNASKEEIDNACKIAQAEEFISALPDGYQTHIDQGGANVSGGQKQRLCIARAILKNPKILILDDSTSAVDTKTDKLIRKGLKELIPNTTKIVIAQRISSIEDADQIIVMDNGIINAIGTHEELLKNNHIYQEVYYSQKKGDTNNANA